MAVAFSSNGCCRRASALFSYPYGGHDAFDAVTTQLVREAGYAMACTGTGGLARPDQYPFVVPRNVVGDWDAEHVRAVAGALAPALSVRQVVKN